MIIQQLASLKASAKAGLITLTELYQIAADNGYSASLKANGKLLLIDRGSKLQYLV